MKERIIILLEKHEDISHEALSILENNNYELLFKRNSKEILSDNKALNSQAILVRGHSVNRQLIDSLPELKVISRMGVGTDNIDISAATRGGIYVCNVPDANFISVAEHVMGMIIVLSHKILDGDKSIRRGDFHDRSKNIGSELHDKNIGIIGFGKIGKLVAKKCINGFNMKAIVFDPYIEQIDMNGAQLTKNLSYLYEESDFITLHLPYSSTLHHFINKTSFEEMKKRPYIINCSRGGLIDESALYNALLNNNISGAGIDVFYKEPVDKNHPLLTLNNVLATPHMGASTKEALDRMSLGAVESIITTLNGSISENILNSF